VLLSTIVLAACRIGFVTAALVVVIVFAACRASASARTAALDVVIVLAAPGPPGANALAAALDVVIALAATRPRLTCSAATLDAEILFAHVTTYCAVVRFLAP
jgi:hypothetical protein